MASSPSSSLTIAALISSPQPRPAIATSSCKSVPTSSSTTPTQRFDELTSDIDVVFDCVGGETFERSFRVIKLGGHVVTIAASEEAEAVNDERKKNAFFIVEPNQNQLIEITKLIEAGKLKPFIDAVVPLENAAAAYDGSLKNRQGRGKIAVEIAL